MIRSVDIQDIPYIESWGYGDIISAYGYIAENPLGIPVLYGCLFPCPGGPAFVESYFASPFIGKSERRLIIPAMLEYMLEEARRLGCYGVVSSSAIPTLKAVLTQHGFEESAQNVTVFYRRLR